nr:unnamed protein product [Haemonchus contortus]
MWYNIYKYESEGFSKERSTLGLDLQLKWLCRQVSSFVSQYCLFMTPECFHYLPMGRSSYFPLLSCPSISAS